MVMQGEKEPMIPPSLNFQFENYYYVISLANLFIFILGSL